MKDETNKDYIDLGSETTEDFDPFASDDELGDEDATETADTEPTPPAPKPAKPSAAFGNPLEKAIGAAETKEVEKAQQGLFEKQPVFEYAGATETIDDTSKTFEELRIEEAADFPELEDGKRVSWTVEYGKITKAVADPKGTSIAKMKTDIEMSKEFLDALKKAKDKNPVCKVKPRVTAQSKGTAYKGVYVNIDEATASGKLITLFPATDGNVYEMRNTEMGQFITLATNNDILREVKAGFIPALPPVPLKHLQDIICFFKITAANGDKEALANVYWDKLDEVFVTDIPEQTASRFSVKSETNPAFDGDRYIHYIDIHSHGSMKAFFSAVDNADEKATRVYVVVGNVLDDLPEIKARISNGGKHLEINPDDVFECAYNANEQMPEINSKAQSLVRALTDRVSTLFTRRSGETV